MLDERAAFRGGVAQPRAARAKEQRWMDFSEVVQVVRHAPADQRRGVVLQPLEQREHAVRVLVEPGDPRRPWQPKARALRDQTSNVRVAIAGPAIEPGQSALRVLGDERTD